MYHNFLSEYGRTWLRIIIGNVLKNHYKLESNEIIEIHKLPMKSKITPIFIGGCRGVEQQC